MLYHDIELDDHIFERLACEAKQRGLSFVDYASHVLFGAVGEYASHHAEPCPNAAPAEGN